MLRAEYLGVDAMARTGTIGVPRPVAFGEHLGGGVGGDIAFVVFQYLEFGGGGSELELGRSLANVSCFLGWGDDRDASRSQPKRRIRL